MTAVADLEPDAPEVSQKWTDELERYVSALTPGAIAAVILAGDAAPAVTVAVLHRVMYEQHAITLLVQAAPEAKAEVVDLARSIGLQANVTSDADVAVERRPADDKVSARDLAMALLPSAHTPFAQRNTQEQLDLIRKAEVLQYALADRGMHVTHGLPAAPPAASVSRTPAQIRELNDHPALCPMPGCDDELYLTREESVPLYRDSVDADVAPGSGITSGWRVECGSGHVVLLPGDPHTADDNPPFGTECAVCAEDGGDHDDFARLRAILGAMAVVQRDVTAGPNGSAAVTS